jgi:hypothetical protein
MFGNNCAVVLKEFEPHAERPIDGLFFKSALVRPREEEKRGDTAQVQSTERHSSFSTAYARFQLNSAHGVAESPFFRTSDCGSETQAHRGKSVCVPRCSYYFERWEAGV